MFRIWHYLVGSKKSENIMVIFIFLREGFLFFM